MNKIHPEKLFNSTSIRNLPNKIDIFLKDISKRQTVEGVEDLLNKIEDDMGIQDVTERLEGEQSLSWADLSTSQLNDVEKKMKYNNTVISSKREILLGKVKTKRYRLNEIVSQATDIKSSIWWTFLDSGGEGQAKIRVCRLLELLGSQEISITYFLKSSVNSFFYLALKVAHGGIILKSDDIYYVCERMKSNSGCWSVGGTNVDLIKQIFEKLSENHLIKIKANLLLLNLETVTKAKYGSDKKYDNCLQLEQGYHEIHYNCVQYVMCILNAAGLIVDLNNRDDMIDGIKWAQKHRFARLLMSFVIDNPPYSKKTMQSAINSNVPIELLRKE